MDTTRLKDYFTGLQARIVSELERFDGQAFRTDSWQRPEGGGGISRLLDGVFVLVGTLSTLLYFSFSAKAQRNAAPQRPVAVRAAAGVGQIFIAITLGSLFAGVFTASLTALIERLGFLLNLVRTMVF